MSASELQATSLRDIEPTLRQIWRESVDTDRGIMQVRTLNLVVFVPIDHLTPEVLRTVNEVSIDHPGRTITLIASDTEEPPHAEVSLACRLGPSDKQICGEQITLRSGNGGAPLPSTTASLLLPGLPVFVWWIGDPQMDDPIFDALTKQADRVIVDARSWSAPERMLRVLAQMMQDTPRLIFTDLLWAALTPLRGMLAQCFDLPDSQAQLAHLQQINITHGPSKHDRLEALLLVGWLGSRLGWSVDREHGLQIHNADGEPIAVTLHDHEHSDINAIELRSNNARFKVTYRHRATCADMQIDLPGATPLMRVVHLKSQPLTALLGEELMVLERDQSYEGSVQFAAKLALE